MKLSPKEKAKKNLNIGNIAESIFQTEIIKRGYQISKPLHNNENYDFIVDNNGKLTKVQVKSTTFYDDKAPGGRYMVKTSRGNFYNSSLYDKKFVDIIAVFIQNEHVWYLIPVENIRTNCIRLYPHKEISNGLYESFRNVWEQF